MVYYDRPTRFAPGLEDIDRRRRSRFDAGRSFCSMRKGGIPAGQIAAKIRWPRCRPRPDSRSNSSPSEPLIVDPGRHRLGADGKFWVVEMRDYPMGMDGKWKPGSRIKYLEATNGDGKYDKATVFLDNLPFATGVTAVAQWRAGLRRARYFICTSRSEQVTARPMSCKKCSPAFSPTIIRRA